MNKNIIVAALIQLIWAKPELYAHELINNLFFINHHGSPSSEIVQQWQRTFDNRGRELTTLHRLGREGQWHTLSDRSYDAIGRLASENRAGVTTTDYTYDIRSRLTSIRSFHYKQSLAYALGGNVSRMSWSCYCPDNAERSYQYSYDALGRLTAADYSDAADRAGAFSTAYTYDLNGNILSLSRMGVYDYYRGRVQYGMVDDLTLTYSGNRLLSVTDNCYGPFYQGAYHFVDGADETEEYTYDANGNTDADLNRGIVSSRYDINNRPRSIDFADGSRTSYLYDASGRKLRTIHEVAQLPIADPSVSSSPEMVRRAVTDYCGAIVYEDSLVSRINIDGGYLSYTYIAGNRLATPEYHYYLTDHLGNNRVDLTDDGGVWQAMDYYPFGMPMGSSYLPGAQRWLFGGKELDRTSGLDLYDQEARAYDPSLGCFRNPDPLAEKYHPLSPYLFCAANPLLLVDPDGKKVEVYATKLPVDEGEARLDFGLATHTFIVVRNKKGEVREYFAYGADGDWVAQIKAAAGVGGRLQKMSYIQDKAVYEGSDKESLKTVITVKPPEGMTQEEFDNKVIETANSFGNNENIKYRLDAGESVLVASDLFGNCNSSTSTILLKSGVSKEAVNDLKSKLELTGFLWGFSTHAKPWTASEQQKAVNNVGPVIRDVANIISLIRSACNVKIK